MDWDQGAHLHPDERFLTMVGNAMKTPSSFEIYFNPSLSGFNPVNIGFPFYVYGVFPLILNKLIAVVLHTDTYYLFTLQGRILSAVADMITLFFVYGIANKLFFHKKNNSIPLLSIFFYAITVYSIQASHFYTTDTFLNMFMTGSVYFALGGKRKKAIVSALFFGLGIACKISAIYIIPLVGVLLCVSNIQLPITNTQKNNNDERPTIELILRSILNIDYWILVLFAFVTYITVRISNPYYFQTTNFFDLQVNEAFVSNIKQLQLYSSGSIWYPPMVQWYSKLPGLFSLFNLAVLGLGIPYFIFVLYGLFDVCRNLKFKNFPFQLEFDIPNLSFLMIMVWTVCYFLYNSIQKTPSIRYLIYVFPYLALFAAAGYESSIKYLVSSIKRLNGKVSLRSINFILNTLYLILLLSWPLIFSTIYFNKHTRIQASEWIYRQVPSDSKLLYEYWDDPLPVSLGDDRGKGFRLEQLNVFDPDTTEKWKIMSDRLKNADYLVLSSNRGWGSIMTVPEKYPKMSAYYHALFMGKTGYRLAASFCPFYYISCDPKVLSNPLLLNWFEEMFTVYDHPTVFIFKKT